MPRPGIDKYRDIYQPEDIPSSKPPPEPRRIKILRVGAIVMLAVLLIGIPIYYYASQRGIGVFMDEDDPIHVEKGKELVAVQQLVKEGKRVRALEVIRTLYKLHPRNVEYVSTGAWVHFKMEQYRRALELSEQAVQLDPGRARDHAVMGACRLFFKQYPGALENSLKALELDPEQPLAYLTLGEVYLKTGDNERALPALKQAGRLDPDNPRVWTRLSSAFIRLEQWDHAELAARRALELKPDSAGGHFNLAMIYYKVEQGHKAVSHMQRAEDLYHQAEQHEWAGKARQNKELIIRKFKLRPEDIIH
jgi:tetratricopeptide (TPR) repeat protein